MRNLLSTLFLLVLLPILSAQSVEDLKRLGSEKMASGLYTEALDYFKQAIILIDDEPLHSTIYGYAGVCAKELNDISSAKAYFICSIERGIAEPQIFDLLGDISRREKDYATQIMAYNIGVERSPGDKQKYQLKLCSVFKKQKDTEQLLSMSETILSYKPQCLKALEYKGTALQYQKKMKEAEIVFKQLYTLDNKNLNANIFLGNYNYQVGRSKLVSSRKKYDKIPKPTRVQWHEQNEKSKAIMEKHYRSGIMHLEHVYAHKPQSSIKKMLYTMHSKMGEKEKAALYKAN